MPALHAKDPVAIERLLPEDHPAAVELLTEVFWDGPLDRAVVGGRPSRRRRASRASMEANLVAAEGRADLRALREGGELRGVLIAVPPGLGPLPPPPLRVQLRIWLLQGPRAASRWREVYEAFQAERPKGLHWYLSLLAVAPGSQGRGLGSALLAAWLADVDARRESAWLETGREENVRFYERQGFEVAGELRVFDQPVWLMGRPPRPAPG